MDIVICHMIKNSGSQAPYFVIVLSHLSRKSQSAFYSYHTESDDPVVHALLKMTFVCVAQL